MKYSSQQSGFVILFSVVISTMIILIGAGIFSVAFKETVLSSTAAESAVALFAADTGLECTFYHELVQGGSGTSYDCGGASQAKSNVQTILVTSPLSGGTLSLDEYDMRFDLLGQPSCGYVSVGRGRMRDFPDPGLPGATISIPGTLIVARGYNVCNGNQPDTSSQFLVERRLEAWYPDAIPAPAGGGPTGGGGVIVPPGGGNPVGPPTGGGGGGAAAAAAAATL